MMIEARNPLTQREVFEYLDNAVKKEEDHWGVDSFYAKQARKVREKKVAEYKAGEVIPVYYCEYCDSYGNGTGEYTDILYSNGTVRTLCYGYSD